MIRPGLVLKRSVSIEYMDTEYEQARKPPATAKGKASPMKISLSFTQNRDLKLNACLSYPTKN